MAEYKILIKPSAVKEIEKISRKTDRRRIIERIEALVIDPQPQGSQKLSGQERYRLRQGNYRIIYAIEDGEFVVYVVKIGHRRDIYRGGP